MVGHSQLAPLPPNQSELVGSPRMRRLVDASPTCTTRVHGLDARECPSSLADERHDVTRIVAATLLLSLLSLVISMGFLSIATNKPLWIIAGLTLALERISSRRSEPEPA